MTQSGGKLPLLLLLLLLTIIMEIVVIHEIFSSAALWNLPFSPEVTSD